MPDVIMLAPPKLPKRLMRKRVAAYARVSSDKDAMQHSLAAQVSKYSEMIQRRHDWEYLGVYADEAFTGTKAERPGFQRLMTDCRDGKIDIVLTKSISRFARNTLTTLEAVRELKERGIDVWFERENIHTMSGEGELMLTILASYAQEESRSVSENCKWRIKNMFEKGIPNNDNMLGYRLVDGKYHIVPEEAKTVKMIFDDFLSGMGRIAIAEKLNGMGVKTRRGHQWGESTLFKLLRNEKYAGNMLMQKTFVEDHLNKRKRLNRGERQMVDIRGSHESIIAPAVFDRVQQELERRAAYYHPSSAAPGEYPFTGKIRCALCGSYYRRKINSGRQVWICHTYNRLGKAVCHAKQIPEETLMAVTADVLGLAEFDAGLFHAKVSEIVVPGSNKLLFVFMDGTSKERSWTDRSRSEGWTDDMRQAARQRACAKKEMEIEML